MTIHHLNCGTLHPPSQLLVNGRGSLTAPAILVCHCLVVQTGKYCRCRSGISRPTQSPRSLGRYLSAQSPPRPHPRRTRDHAGSGTRHRSARREEHRPDPSRCRSCGRYFRLPLGACLRVTCSGRPHHSRAAQGHGAQASPCPVVACTSVEACHLVGDVAFAPLFQAQRQHESGGA